MNRQINPVNICVLSCKFCEFFSKEGREDAYVLSERDISETSCCRFSARPLLLISCR